ncbi:MAG: nonstructural protein [Microvirus sp.]|nr:MAG: nonstructural protein [Microvirus sp.]
MTILQVCALFDSAVQAYNRPIFVPHVGAAIRSFTDEVNRPAQDNQMYHHPEDFQLMQLANWNEETGKFTSLETPRILARGTDVQEQK